MKERPILFSAPMVRALLDGSKVQTRRLVKLPENAKHVQYWAPPSGRSEAGWAEPGVNYWTPDADGENDSNHLDRCPYGQPGDRLWVRETWGYRGSRWHGSEPDVLRIEIEYQTDGSRIEHVRPAGNYEGIPKQRKQKPDESHEDYYHDYLTSYFRQFRPSIHMPRWASRILLEITGVRVERLQDISTEDIIAEGLSTTLREHDAEMDLRDQWRALWESTGGDWDSNPWIWVIEFKRVEKATAEQAAFMLPCAQLQAQAKDEFDIPHFLRKGHD